LVKKAPNRVAITNTRLRINGCALSSRKSLSSAPLFLNTENRAIRASAIATFPMKNKGALLGIPTLLRAQLLMIRRVLVCSPLFFVRFLVLTMKLKRKKTVINPLLKPAQILRGTKR
jgi:hypothetical protein